MAYHQFEIKLRRFFEDGNCADRRSEMRQISRQLLDESLDRLIVIPSFVLGCCPMRILSFPAEIEAVPSE
jgi:hypothetical protein